jgi:signal transduction histidine kinase
LTKPVGADHRGHANAVVGDSAAQSSPEAANEDAPRSISATDVTVTPLGADWVEGSAIVRDIYGASVLRVSIMRDRDIYAEGQHTLSFFLAILAIGGTLLCIAALVFADRAIFRRLSLLAAEVRAIGELTDFSGEVTAGGDDEIAFLANAINDTLGTLARTHRQLHDSHVELEQTTADLKRAQQELGKTANRLRRLTRHLQTMREDERALVANEIHDQIGQGLTALKMDLATMQRAADRGETPSSAMVAQMSDVLTSLLENVRRLSSGLHPSMLEDLGIAEAFEWHLGEFANAKGISTSLKIQGPLGGIEAGRALTLFRILEEALQVSAEDSTVTEVAVTLTIESRYACSPYRITALPPSRGMRSPEGIWG